MERKFIFSLVLLVFSVPTVFANVYQDIKNAKKEFQDNTGQYASCSSFIEPEKCLMGLKTLIEISHDTVFPNANFNSLWIENDFRTVDFGNGEVDLKFNASSLEMKVFLLDQPTFYATVKSKVDEFRAKTGHSVFCSNSEIGFESCVEGLNKLLDLSTTDIFPTSAFDTIFIEDEFSDVNAHGSIDVNFAASEDDIAAFLRRQ